MDAEALCELALWVDQWEATATVALEDIPELRVPNLAFTKRITFHGSVASAELIEFGGGHTTSDALLWLPEARIAFMGDLISSEPPLLATATRMRCGGRWMRYWR